MAYKNPLDPRAREARRKHYQKNKLQYYANNRLKQKRMREYIARVKNVPCADCQESYPPYVMDFDHRDPSTKVADIGYFLKLQSWKRLEEEISKCDIVCSNCHRIRTAILLEYKDYVIIS